MLLSAIYSCSTNVFAVWPPSARMSTPETKPAPGETRKPMSSAISYGWPQRPAGMRSSWQSAVSGSRSMSSWCIGVRYEPGDTDRMRVFFSANRATFFCV